MVFVIAWGWVPKILLAPSTLTLVDWGAASEKIIDVVKLIPVSVEKREFKKYLRLLNLRDPWKEIQVLNKNKSSIPTLTLGDVVAQSDLEKANLFNSFFFVNCFNKSYPPIQSQVAPPHLPLPPEEILCLESEVCDLLVALDPNKATGRDGISAKMLESTAYSIAPSLNKLFNLSLTTGILPLALKKSSVVPIPKNQKLSDPYN